MRKQNSGFTLLELSITLIVLGLIITGVISGGALIKTAQMRSILTNVEDNRGAIAAFKAKYLGLPGDIYNADSFWAAAANGNGDDQIAYSGTGTANEGINFWHHLYLAELISNDYTGSCTNSEAVPGTNVPDLKLGSAKLGFSVDYTSFYDLDETARSNGDNDRNIIIVGMQTSNDMSDTIAFIPEDAYALDDKVDDGLPKSGTVWADDTGDCINGSDAYDLTDKDVECRVAFVLGSME